MIRYVFRRVEVMRSALVVLLCVLALSTHPAAAQLSSNVSAGVGAFRYQDMHTSALLSVRGDVVHRSGLGIDLFGAFGRRETRRGCLAIGVCPDPTRNAYLVFLGPTYRHDSESVSVYAGLGAGYDLGGSVHRKTGTIGYWTWQVGLQPWLSERFGLATELRAIDDGGSSEFIGSIGLAYRLAR
jgi:hypothetical protein